MRDRSIRSLPAPARAYLSELARQLRGLPRERRREVVRDIAAHIAAELDLVGGGHGVSLAKGSAADRGVSDPVSGILERLGRPHEIARAARAELPDPPVRIAGRDVAAIVLLLVGGFAFVIGWFVGLVLLWTSTAWRLRDKVIGTLLVPGGLLAPVLAAGLAVASTSSDQGSGSGTDAAGLALVVVSVGGPVFTAIWLGVRARRG